MYYLSQQSLFFLIVYLLLLQDPKKSHRQRPSMFEDADGDEILPFPCVSGFALESMHLIDGGVLKDIHSTFEKLVKKVWEDPTDPRNVTQISIRDTVVADRIAFLNKFCLTEQARKLRFVIIRHYYLIFHSLLFNFSDRELRTYSRVRTYILTLVQNYI